MNRLIRNYVLATILPIPIIMAAILLVSKDSVDSGLTVISACVCFPIMMMGLYMHLEGSGERWINGVDWRKMSPEEVRNAVSYWGPYMTIGAFLLLLSVNLILSYMILSFVLIGVSIVVMLVPLAKIHPKAKIKAMKDRSSGVKAAYYVAILVLSLLVIFGLGIGEDNAGGVNVSVGDTELSVKAPMFDETFAYSAIEELGYDPDFDKGSRISGYGTNTISSGKFVNDVFGKYRLASYTKISPCIWLKVDGDYYAFNQSSDDATYEIYQQLRAKTGL